jgi:acetylornithine/LysW-gamma-L-lysine aminotransferase
MHGSTFGGHPVGCAAAFATMNALLRDDIISQVTDKGALLVDAIRAGNAPLIREIRHLGLMIGLELKTRVRPILSALANRGVLALPAGNKVLRLLPPLTITEEDLQQVAAVVIEACSTSIQAAAAE